MCVSKATIIDSDNGLSPDRHQAIIWTNAGILLIEHKIQWNLNWNSYIFIHENAFKIVICQKSVILSQPQCVNTPAPALTCVGSSTEYLDTDMW